MPGEIRALFFFLMKNMEEKLLKKSERESVFGIPINFDWENNAINQFHDLSNLFEDFW